MNRAWAALRASFVPLFIAAFVLAGAGIAARLPGLFGHLGAVLVLVLFLLQANLIGPRRSLRALAEVRLRWPVRVWPWGALVGLAQLAVLFGWIVWSTRAGQRPSPAPSGVTEAAFLFPAFIAPVIEEVAFRGWLLRRLERLLDERVAILVSAVLFAAVHFQLGGLPYRAVIGIALAALVIATRSLWPAVALHVVNNSIVVLISRHEAAVEAALRPVSWLGPILMAVGGVALSVGLHRLWQSAKQRRAAGGRGPVPAAAVVAAQP